MPKHRRHRASHVPSPDRNPPIPAGIKLLPDSATGYAVSLDEVSIGRVYRDTRAPFRHWFFRNDAEGWYGEVSTQKQAIAALVELATRNGLLGQT